MNPEDPRFEKSYGQIELSNKDVMTNVRKNT